MNQQIEAREITTCQICSRVIKSKSGLIAHHGYRRPGHGWQTASCPGAQYLPYEISCDRLAEIIEIVKDHLINMENALATFVSAPPEKLTVIERKSSWNRDGKEVTYTRPDDFVQNSYRRSIPRTYENVYSQRTYEYERDIKAAKSDLVMMERRLAEWKAPMKQEEIAQEEKNEQPFLPRDIVTPNSLYLHNAKWQYASVIGIHNYGEQVDGGWVVDLQRMKIDDSGNLVLTPVKEYMLAAWEVTLYKRAEKAEPLK